MSCHGSGYCSGIVRWFQWPGNACNWLRPGVIDIEVQLQEAAVDIVLYTLSTHVTFSGTCPSELIDTSTLRTIKDLHIKEH